MDGGWFAVLQRWLISLHAPFFSGKLRNDTPGVFFLSREYVGPDSLLLKRRRRVCCCRCFFSKIINAGGVFDKSHAHITLEEKTNFVTSVWWRIGGIRPHQKNVF